MSDEALRRLLPLVKREAWRLLRRLPSSVDPDDLVQVGWIGASEALERYDPAGGASIETFAAHRARGAMLDALRADDLLTRDARRDRRALESAITGLEHRLGRPPRRGEIASALGWDDGRLRDAETQATPVELSEAHEAAIDADPLAELLEHEREQLLQAELARLPYRTREILRLVGDGELNGHGIGVLFGITPSRVSQVVSAAVAQVGVRIAAADIVAYPDRPPEPPLYRITWPAGSLVG